MAVTAATDSLRAWVDERVGVMQAWFASVCAHHSTGGARTGADADDGGLCARLSVELAGAVFARDDALRRVEAAGMRVHAVCARHA